MPKSMTGYGKAEADCGIHKIQVEVKSQNHRFKDIILRLPKGLQNLEHEVKQAVSQAIQRGRVELTIFLNKWQNENTVKLEPNKIFITDYLKLAQEIKEEFLVEGEITLEQILREPEAIHRSPEMLNLEEIRPVLIDCVLESLRHADVMRLKEGEFIVNDLKERLEVINQRLEDIRERAKILPIEQKRKLQERLKILLDDIPLDENRVALEIAIYADRCDITEEIIRAMSHISQFRELLALDEAVGRKLDFLIQEIHREVTTLANKAQDVYISQKSVEIKAELEKLREQVQNLE